MRRRLAGPDGQVLQLHYRVVLPRLRALGQLLQEHVHFSLHFDHQPSLAQLRLGPLRALAQPRDLAVPPVCWLAASLAVQRRRPALRQRPTPSNQMPRMQPFPAQQRTPRARLGQPVVLGHNRPLVQGGEPPTARPFGYLRVRGISHMPSMSATKASSRQRGHERDGPLLTLSQWYQAPPGSPNLDREGHGNGKRAWPTGVLRASRGVPSQRRRSVELAV